MRKQSLLESNNEHEWKLKSLSRVRGQQRDRCVAFVIVLIGNERGVIDKLSQSFITRLVIVHRRVDELLEVLKTPFRFIRVFGAKRAFVTSLDDGCLHDIRSRRTGLCKIRKQCNDAAKAFERADRA